MLVLVRFIQSLSSCLLVISLMPLQLSVAMRSLCWYGACSSCACGPGSRVASAGTPDFLFLACLRPSCFLVFLISVRLRRAARLRVPRGGLWGGEGCSKSVEGDLLPHPAACTRKVQAVGAANPARLVEALQGSRGCWVWGVSGGCCFLRAACRGAERIGLSAPFEGAACRGVERIEPTSERVKVLC